MATIERIDDLAWTEIDFPSDIEKALSLLPRIAPRAAAAHVPAQIPASVEN